MNKYTSQFIEVIVNGIAKHPVASGFGLFSIWVVHDKLRITSQQVAAERENNKYRDELANKIKNKGFNFLDQKSAEYLVDNALYHDPYVIHSRTVVDRYGRSHYPECEANRNEAILDKLKRSKELATKCEEIKGTESWWDCYPCLLVYPEKYQTHRLYRQKEELRRGWEDHDARAALDRMGLRH